MPLGWYLAQGLIPIVPHSSDDEEGPCELPDGRIVCGPHGLVQCGRCRTAYSFMDDDVDEHAEHLDDDEILDGERPAGERSDDKRDHEGHHLPPQGPDEMGPEMVRGTGLVFPTRFQLGHRPPMELFSGRLRVKNMTR